MIFVCVLTELNYFQVKVLFDQLKATESGKKNLIGQYTSATMKVGWVKIKEKIYNSEFIISRHFNKI